MLQEDVCKHFPTNKRPPKYTKQTDRIEKINRPFNNSSWRLHYSTFNSGEILLLLMILTSALWDGRAGIRTHLLWFRTLRLSDLSRVVTTAPIEIGLVLFLTRY